MPDVSIGATAAYLAVPVGPAGPWPGVVVIHEAFGLNADIRGHADRLAALGYLAVAPDLLEGRPWLRCVRTMFRQLTAGSGPAFDTLDECRAGDFPVDRSDVGGMRHYGHGTLCAGG